MANDLTAKEMATMIANANGWDRHAADKLHRQIKFWSDKGLFNDRTTGTDGRGTHRFGHDEVYRARLFAALADCGLGIEDMHSALGGIEPKPSAMVRDENGSQPDWHDPKALEHHYSRSVVRKVRAGQFWECRLTVLRGDRGDRSVNGRCVRIGEPELTPEQERTVAKFHESQALKPEIEITIDLGGILRPLFAAESGK